MHRAHEHHSADEVVTHSIPRASADKNVTGRNGRIKSQGCGYTGCAVSRLFDLKGHARLAISSRRSPRPSNLRLRLGSC
jgi:hypothetical protein